MPTFEELMRDLARTLEPAPPCEEACKKTCEILRHYSLQQVQLPDRLRQPASTSYARHLIHRESGDGFCVVAMVWSPGQGTAVHDHGGTWCVEGCLEGQLAITSYRMLDRLEADRVRFEQESYVEVGCGSVGCLIPPFEHHKIHNPFDRPAITLHVYGRELCNCTRFLEEGADTYRIERVPLSYTTTP